VSAGEGQPGPAQPDVAGNQARAGGGRHARNGRSGWNGRNGGRKNGGGRGEQFMVPRAEFRSYYGRPVIKEPVWREPDVPGYLFFGGLAGASSVLAAAAQLTGRPRLARAAKAAGFGGISVSTVFLIHDLGRPARFHHMLRVFKLSSPMSVGSWILSAYGPAAGVAALSDFTGILPVAGSAATFAAALVGPAVTTYTAVLLCDTAVPAWHEAHREMPYVFAGSAASAAGGFGLLAAPLGESEPARRLAVVGAAVELTAKKLLEWRLGPRGDPYQTGRAATLLRTGEVLTAFGLAGAGLSRRSRVGSALSGLALLGASALTRFGIFEGGLASARDPQYTIVPQRERKRARQQAERTGRQATAPS
jgi:hypothetical protein